MNWQIYTLGAGNFLTLVFNGVAAILGNADYMYLLKIAMILGILTVMVRVAYKGAILDIQWLLWAAAIYYIAFLPTATVIVDDELDPTQSGVINNVPIGLAATAGFSSSVGHWLAQTSEAVFSLPDDMDYTTHGMLFGNKLVDAAMRFEITDPRVAGNFASFWQQCVFYDILLGKYSITSLETAPDLWAFVQGNTSVARAFSYQPATGAPQIEVCHTAANGDLNTDLTNEIPNIENLYGAQLVSAASRNAAISEFNTALPVAVQYFSNLADSETQIISQAALSNSMQRGISAWAAKADAPAAAQAYALARAEAERRTTYTVMGELAEKYLPILLNIIQAGIYAIFPIAFIMMLMPGGHRAIFAYAKVLAWITLWPFLFAVIHLAMTVFTAQAAQPAVTLPGGTQVLAMTNYTGFGQVMADYALFAGYLTVSIPLIAWAIVGAGGATLASMAQGILSSYEKTASQAAGEATTGNMSLGNTSFGNANWWAQNTAPVSSMGTATMTGPDGVKLTRTSAGELIQVPQSQLPVNPNISNQIRSSISQQASESVRAAESQMAAYSKAQAASLQSMHGLSEQISNNQGYAQSFDKGSTAAFERHYGKASEYAAQFARENGISNSQSWKVLTSMALGAKVPFPGLSGGGGAELSDLSEDKRASTVKAAAQFADQYKFGEVLKNAETAAQRMTASYSGSIANAQIKQTEATLAHSQELRDTVQGALERASAYQKLRDQAESNSAGFDANMSQAFFNFVSGWSRSGTSGATDLFVKANQGNTAALQTVSNYANAFVKTQLTRAANVSVPPNGAAVADGGATALRKLDATGANNLSLMAKSGISEVRASPGSRTEIESHTEAARVNVLDQEARIDNDRSAKTINQEGVAADDRNRMQRQIQAGGPKPEPADN